MIRCRILIVIWGLLIASNIALAQNNMALRYEVSLAFQAAEQLQSENKYQEALAAYNEILKKYPNTDLKNEIVMKMAQCYSLSGDDDGAIKIYLKLVSDDPNGQYASQAVSLMMNLYSDRYQFNEILAMSNQISQQFPGTEAAAMAAYRVASYLYSQGKSKEAVQEYERFIEKYPNSVMKLTAFNRLIYLYIQENMFEKAEKLIKDNMVMNIRDTYMLQQLATVYQRQKKYDEALEIYQQLLKISPYDIEIYEQLGNLYNEKGDKERAIAEWLKIIASNPNQYSRHQYLAQILSKNGFYDEAVKEYEKAIELEPNFSYIYSQLANLYIVRRQFNSALDVYLRALLRFPVGQSGREEMMKSMLELCAIEDLYHYVTDRLEVHLASYPDNMEALLTLADTRFYQEDYDNSLQLYRKISQLYPDQGLLLFSRAQDLERELHFEHSIRYYQTMIELFPRNPNLRYAILHISQMQSQINQPDQAIANLQKLISQYRENNDFNQDSLWLSAYILMGDIYIQQKKDVQRALYAYIESKRLMETWLGSVASKLLEIELKIADCYRLMEKYDDASRILDFAQLREQSKTALAQVAKLRGDVLFSRGDFERALILYQEAILWPMNEDWINDSLERIALIKEYLDQNNIDILRIYAQVERLKELGQYDEALKLCVSSVDDRLKLAAGELFTLQLKFPEAILTYEQLVKSKSNLAPEAIYRIAGIYSHNLGDREQSIKKYSELIESYPDSIFVAEARKQIRLLASGKIIDRHIP